MLSAFKYNNSSDTQHLRAGLAYTVLTGLNPLAMNTRDVSPGLAYTIPAGFREPAGHNRAMPWVPMSYFNYPNPLKEPFQVKGDPRAKNENKKGLPSQESLSLHVIFEFIF